MLSDGKKASGSIDHKNSPNQNWQLNQTNDSCKKPKEDQRAAEYVSKHNVMRNRQPCEVNVYSRCCHLKFLHVSDEIQSLVGNKGPEEKPEDVQKSRPMAITPPFQVGNYAHKVFG